MLRTVAPNSRVYRVYAIDDDAGVNGRVSYVLSSTTPNCPGCFNIDRTIGLITRGTGSLQPNSEVRGLLLFLATDVCH